MKEFGFSELLLGCIVGRAKLVGVKKYSTKEEFGRDIPLHLVRLKD